MMKVIMTVLKKEKLLLEEECKTQCLEWSNNLKGQISISDRILLQGWCRSKWSCQWEVEVCRMICIIVMARLEMLFLNTKNYQRNQPYLTTTTLSSIINKELFN
jgi:hypothetical protein